MVVRDKLRITVQQFERILADPKNQDKLLELIDGEIVEKMPTEKHGIIVLRIGARLMDHVDEKQLGHVTTEAAHNLATDEFNEYRPDLSFISGDRKPVESGAIPRMPDLAVEVKSPRNTFKGLRDKAEYYLQHGSKMVWLVFPEKRIIEVYTPDEDVQILQIEDTLDGGDVVPEFKLPLDKIFL